jgi:hypothetical protein
MPYRQLRPLLLSVVAVMMMHFQCVFQTYSRQHTLVEKMIAATVKCRMTAMDSVAIQKLEHWSILKGGEFRRGNVSPVNSNDLQRQSIADQMAKLNDSVAKMLQIKVDLQA